MTALLVPLGFFLVAGAIYGVFAADRWPDWINPRYGVAAMLASAWLGVMCVLIVAVFVVFGRPT